MVIHLYKISTLSTCNGIIDSQVKSNPRNNLIYGQHHCGKVCNARGIITARHRGGGHKRLYHKINFQWNEKDIYGKIVTIEYGHNRSAYICLIHYGDGEKRYILHPRGAIVGNTIVSNTEVTKCRRCRSFWYKLKKRVSHRDERSNKVWSRLNSLYLTLIT